MKDSSVFGSVSVKTLPSLTLMIHNVKDTRFFDRYTIREIYYNFRFFGKKPKISKNPISKSFSIKIKIFKEIILFKMMR